MDLLFLTVLLIICMVAAAAAMALLLFVLPVRSVIAFRTDDTCSRLVVTVAWAVFGVRLTRGEARDQVDLLCLSRVLCSLAGDKEPEAALPDTEVPGKTVAEHTLPPVAKTIHLVRELVPPLLSLGSAIWQQSRFDALTGTVTVGFSNPATTGTWYGYYWAVKFLLEEMRICVEVEPVFDREVFACDCEVRLSLHRPILVIAKTFRLLREPAARELLQVLRTPAPSGGAAA